MSKEFKLELDDYSKKKKSKKENIIDFKISTEEYTKKSVTDRITKFKLCID